MQDEMLHVESGDQEGGQVRKNLEGEDSAARVIRHQWVLYPLQKDLLVLQISFNFGPTSFENVCHNN